MEKALDILTQIGQSLWAIVLWSTSVSPLIAILVFAGVFFLIIYTKLNPAETLASVLIVSLVWVAAMPTGFLAMRAAFGQPGFPAKAKCFVSLTKDVDYWISRDDPQSAASCSEKDKEPEKTAEITPEDNGESLPGVGPARDLQDESDQRTQEIEDESRSQEE